ncbi:transposase [Rubritalea spongiae]|uniref:Transposase n=1 Tax=Rubritalea spongiae TaxID=430797 RepID=A0ABW5E7V4_9BACT
MRKIRHTTLYDAEHVGMVREQLELLAASTTEAGRLAYQELRERYTRRMWDLGHFMKTLKQRFSSWYNKKHQRKGTLWEARYKSVLVENGYAARTMAAYIDLNPVRAGMVLDPKDYRWCSYAEAVAGGKLARNGIMRVISEMESDMAADGWAGSRSIEKYDWRNVAGRYRLILYEDGASFGVAEADARRSTKKRRGFSEAELEKELEREGRLSVSAVLGCKSRYFIDSAVLGSKSRVNGVIDDLKGNYLSKNRKMGGSRPRDNLRSSGL